MRAKPAAGALGMAALLAALALTQCRREPPPALPPPPPEAAVQELDPWSFHFVGGLLVITGELADATAVTLKGPTLNEATTLPFGPVRWEMLRPPPGEVAELRTGDGKLLIRFDFDRPAPPATRPPAPVPAPMAAPAKPVPPPPPAKPQVAPAAPPPAPASRPSGPLAPPAPSRPPAVPSAPPRSTGNVLVSPAVPPAPPRPAPAQVPPPLVPGAALAPRASLTQPPPRPQAAPVAPPPLQLQPTAPKGPAQGPARPAPSVVPPPQPPAQPPPRPAPAAAPPPPRPSPVAPPNPKVPPRQPAPPVRPAPAAPAPAQPAPSAGARPAVLDSSAWPGSGEGLNLLRGPKGERRICMTFDGGSTAEVAVDVLDALKSRGIRTTLFLTGEFIHRYPDLVRRMDREGHELGNHTLDHPHFAPGMKRDPRWTRERFQQELLDADRALFKLLGRPFDPYWRAPYGEQTAELRRWAEELGYRHVGWSEGADTLDWATTKERRLYRTGNAILDKLHARMEKQDGDGLIVLMHLGSGRPDGDRPAQVLGPFLDRALRDGWHFVPVSDYVKGLGKPRWEPVRRVALLR